jgi:hypothetical protein
MPTYFFTVVVNGRSTPDRHGKDLPDDGAACEWARQMAVRFSDPRRDRSDGFIAVIGKDARLLFKVPFPRT